MTPRNRFWTHLDDGSDSSAESKFTSSAIAVVIYTYDLVIA